MEKVLLVTIHSKTLLGNVGIFYALCTIFAILLCALISNMLHCITWHAGILFQFLCVLL
jgi:hypothetical protein